MDNEAVVNFVLLSFRANFLPFCVCVVVSSVKWFAVFLRAQSSSSHCQHEIDILFFEN